MNHLNQLTMNMLKFTRLLWVIPIIILYSSCSDSGEEAMNPCVDGPTLSIDEIIASTDGNANGQVTVSATGGSGPYMYSIDGTNFQSNGTFTNLSAGSYTITVKDANECTDAGQATIADVPVVSYANDIRPIIDASCQISPCHGTNTNIPSWASYNDVKAKADRIKARTADKSMPKNGSITDTQIKLIGDWVDQGAPNN